MMAIIYGSLDDGNTDMPLHEIPTGSAGFGRGTVTFPLQSTAGSNLYLNKLIVVPTHIR